MSRYVRNDDARHPRERPVLGLLLVFLFIAGGRGGQASTTPPGPRSRDARPEPEILRKARAYCRRLQTASLDFVCREEIEERTAGRAGRLETLDAFDGRGGPAGHRLVYDYQFVRIGPKAEEVRTLIEEDGIQRNQPNADLLTRTFRYQNVLFGPATLLDDRNAGLYDLVVEAETDVAGRPAVVIDARPRAEAGTKSPPFGRMWISPADGAVLKIEWDEHTLRRYSAIEERAKEFRAKPRLTMTSEFGFEKNGIRFPSRHAIVEAYDREEAGLFVRSRTEVEYLAYKFFTVETSTEYK